MKLPTARLLQLRALQLRAILIKIDSTPWRVPTARDRAALESAADILETLSNTITSIVGGANEYETNTGRAHRGAQ